MMPRLKPKKKEPERLPLKNLAIMLREIEESLLEARLKIAKVWEALYTVGIAEVGPIKEDKDDVPF
jgi:hypothetical protein